MTMLSPQDWPGAKVADLPLYTVVAHSVVDGCKVHSKASEDGLNFKSASTIADELRAAHSEQMFSVEHRTLVGIMCPAQM